MEKEVSEVDRKLFLRKTYLDKIYYHINRNPINQDELYSLIRKFFGEYLKLDYEFTYEELSQELNKVFVTPKVKEHIDDFLLRLSESEYLEETILGTSEINTYLEEFGDIIKNIIYDDQPVHEVESIVQKVLKRHKEPAKIMDVVGINALIEETNFHITNGNMDIAKSSYINLLKAYDTLNKDDKKKLHDGLNEVYERLQTLIKNPASKVGSDKNITSNYAISDSIKKVRDLADDTLFYINASNAESSKRMYAETLKLYESLDPEDKKIMHSRINDLYTQLQALLSVTTYIDAEPVTTSGAKKNLMEEQPDANIGASSAGNVALNMDLSAISSGSPFSTISEPVKTESTIPSNNMLLGNHDSDSNKDVLNIDISTVSSVNTSVDAANMSTEKNTLLMPEMTESTFNTNPNTSINDVKKESSRLTIKGADYSEDNDTVVKEKSVSPNILFTTNDLIEPEENVAAQDASRKSAVESKISPFSKISTKKISSMQTASPTIIPSQTASAPIISTSKPLNASESPKPLQVATSKTALSKVASPQTSLPVELTKPISHIELHKDIPEKIDMDIQKDLKEKHGPEIQSVKPSIPQSQQIIRPSQRPTLPAIHPSIEVTIQPAVDKLNRILKKIDDDIVLDRFDKAKLTYKEALLFYRSMPDENKAKCYEHFYATFKRLDDALHQKSLHDILDKHLLDAEESRRPIALASEKSLDKTNISTESSKIIKMTTLPVMLANNPDMTRVYELIEESYFSMDNDHSDLAMLKYFKALELYHQLPIPDKKKLYSDLYELFKKLSITKKV